MSILKGRIKRRFVPLITAAARHLPALTTYAGIGHIIALHRVVPRHEISRYSMSLYEVTPEILEMTVRFFLDRHYRAISLDQLHERLQHNDEGGRFVAFTFDDGYRDTLTEAYPLLKRYGVPFTINVVPGFLDRTAIMWDYLAQEVVEAHQEIELDTDDGPTTLNCSTPAKKRASCGLLQYWLKDRNNRASIAKLQAFFRRYVPDPYRKTDDLTLDWSQLKDLSQDPLVTVGAHSLNHHVLNTLSEEDAKEEVLGSRLRLESELGRPVRHFCYPYGTQREIGRRETRLVKESSFATGTTGIKGSVFPAHVAHTESLPRYSLGSTVDKAYLETIANGSLPLLVNRLRKFSTV